MINGRNNILINNKNIPPINPKTKANTANTVTTNEKIKAKGVKTKTISTNNSFKPNSINNIAIKTSINNPDKM